MCFRAVCGGPGGFDVFELSDAFAFKECYGMHKSFNSLNTIAMAFNLMMVHSHYCKIERSHNIESRGIEELHHALRFSIDAEAELDRVVAFQKWYDSPFFRTLHHGGKELERKFGIKLDCSLRCIACNTDSTRVEDIQAK